MIDFITVVFRQELFYLQIQARSIEQYVDSAKIGSIFVVVNDTQEICSRIDPKWWGINENKVKIIWASFFGRTDSLHGWASQQYYKLATANVAVSEWSACLDAKTWFVRTLDFTKLFSKSGKVKFSSFPTIPVFKPAEKTVNDFFGISMSSVIGPGGVPFLFKTEEINLLTEYLLKKGTSLFQYFTTAVREPSCLTEFMFYSGWIIFRHGDYNVLYDTLQYYSVTNIANFEANDFDLIYPRMIQENNLTASIHRSVYPSLTEKQLKTWVDFLRSKNLLENLDDDLVITELLNTVNVE